MSYVYSEVDGSLLDPETVAYAEHVLSEARYSLNLRHGALAIRWYTREPEYYPLTRHGRSLDVVDARNLTGWHAGPPCIAVRVDQTRREIALTIGHEVLHAWEDAHGKPYDEARAESFARRLLANIEGDTK